MDVLLATLLSLALAFLAESMVEYVFASWMDLLMARCPALKEVRPLKYVAMGVGLGLAFAYRLDMIEAAFGIASNPAWVGTALTGMAIGRGANYVHDFARAHLGLDLP